MTQRQKNTLNLKVVKLIEFRVFDFLKSELPLFVLETDFTVKEYRLESYHFQAKSESP